MELWIWVLRKDKEIFSCALNIQEYWCDGEAQVHCPSVTALIWATRKYDYFGVGVLRSWFKKELIYISTKLLCFLSNEQLRKDALGWTNEESVFRFTWNKDTFHFKMLYLNLRKEVVQSFRKAHILLVFFFLKHLETKTSLRIVVIYPAAFLLIFFLDQLFFWEPMSLLERGCKFVSVSMISSRPYHPQVWCHAADTSTPLGPKGQ